MGTERVSAIKYKRDTDDLTLRLRAAEKLLADRGVAAPFADPDAVFDALIARLKSFRDGEIGGLELRQAELRLREAQHWYWAYLDEKERGQAHKP